MNAQAERPDLVMAMLDTSFYPHSPRSVEVRDTHISWVFLAGDLAYKVKKPVVFPFLDYGTLERRHEMCREEVRLNRRLAPEIYLRVVGIAHRDGGYELAAEGDPAAVEFAVEMRRVQEDRSLASLSARGDLSGTQVDAVARRLARFHAEAAIAPPDARDLDFLAATLAENLMTMREADDDALGEVALAAGERFTQAFLATHRDELEARADAGLVRDGHGDLRAEHVIVPAAGDVYVYDCVEFNRSLREIDVAADLAFLVMDLTRLGAEQHAVRLVDAYRAAGGDPGEDAVLWFFASYRAWVRAKVAVLRALELREHGPERERERSDARALFRLGRRFAWRARGSRILVICGVAGSGKTSLARELADLSGWPHLSSDVIRKRLAGLVPTQRAAAEHYTEEFTLRTYRELGKAARAAVVAGGGVIVDATFHLRGERDAFRSRIGKPPAPVLFVECRAPRDVLIARVRERQLASEHESDADVNVLEQQIAEFESLSELPATARAALNTAAPLRDLVGDVEALLDDRARYA